MNRFLIASGAIALSLFLSWAPVHSVQRQLSDGWSWSPPTGGTSDDAYQDFVIQFGRVCQGGGMSEGTLRGTVCTAEGTECDSGGGTCTADTGQPIPFAPDFIPTNQDVRECRGVVISLNANDGSAPTDQSVSVFDCSAPERTSASSCVYRGSLDSDTPTMSGGFSRGFVLVEVNEFGDGAGGVVDISCNTKADRFFDGSEWADITRAIPLTTTPGRSDRGNASAKSGLPASFVIGTAPFGTPPGVEGAHSPVPMCHYTLRGYPGYGGWAGTGDGSTEVFKHSICASGNPGADPADPTDFSCYCERAWNAIGHGYTIRENTYGGPDVYYNPKTRLLEFDVSLTETQEINQAMQFYEDTGCKGGETEGGGCSDAPSTEDAGRWASSSNTNQYAAFINVYNDTNGSMILKAANTGNTTYPANCIQGNDNCEPNSLIQLMTGDYRGGNPPNSSPGRHGVKSTRAFDAETCWADHGVARVCFDGTCTGEGEGAPDNPMGVNGDMGPATKVSNGTSIRKMTGRSQDFDTCIRRTFGPEGGFALSVDKDASIGFWDFQEVDVVMNGDMVTNSAIESVGHPYRSGDGPLIISGGTACHIDDQAAYFASVIDEDNFELVMDYQTAVRGFRRENAAYTLNTSSGRGEFDEGENSIRTRTSGTCSNDVSESCSGEAAPHTHCKNIGGTGAAPGAFCYEAPQSFDDNTGSFCTIRINKKGVEIPITRPVAQGTGAASHGVIAWGDDSDAAFDTGDEVCAAQMMKCGESRKASAMGTDIGCGADAAESFIASCF